VISRLTAEWQADYDAWQKRDLSARRYVYVWADGVYLQARMEEAAECMLVLAGATPEGKKELVGFQTGVREGARSWRELLIDIKQRARDCAAPGGRRARPLEGDRGGLSEHQAPVAVGFTRPPTC
jgi:putative transposase